MVQKKIDEAAIMWNKTKDPYYKDLWYKLVKEFANGPNSIKRRVISINSSVKTDDGRYRVIQQPKLFRFVRRAKVKTNGLRR
jgi:hypothetical protein